MRYKVVYGDPDKGFVDGVNDLIDKGWKPLGGVAVCPMPDSFPSVFQAMILDEEGKESKMRWIEDNEAWFTPGGEPVYRCSNCGCRKVFGVENGPKLKRCPNCGQEEGE